MRVAHFAKYAFNRIGGMERHIETLTRALAAQGVDVTVFSYDPSKSRKSIVVDGVRVEPVPSQINFSSQSIAPGFFTHTRRLAKLQPFDIIHQHWPDPFAHVVATLVPGKPIHVVTWHSDIVRQKFLRPIYRAIAPRFLAQPDALIGATQAHLMSPQIACFAPPERRHIIPYSIDVRAYQATPELLESAEILRATYGGGPLVFALGRHVYYKGFETLIRAMTRVPATLILGGEGPLTPKFRQLADTLGAPVKFIGSISDSDLPKHYQACDVFCLPSVAQTEAFGLVQIEAMACGKPLVNTALQNGVNELAPHNVCALTVPPGNVDALADALTHIIFSRDLATRLGTTGQARIMSKFTVAKMVESTISLYDSLLASRNSSAT